MLAIAAAAFVFYAPSLGFGFFNDDPTGHFRWMEGRTIWSLLTDASGHGYYRPVSFILWQILRAILGRHDPFVLHLLNVSAHAANAALVVWLARRLSGRPACAILAGLLFAFYPFSYEATSYVGSFVHPLTTLLTLLTLAFYICWRERNVRWTFFAAHFTLALAVFSQENAVIVPLLLLALDLMFLEHSKATFFASLSFFAEPAIFAIVWLLVPKTAAGRAFSLEAMRANVLPFVQALVYPLAPLANHNPMTLAVLAVIGPTALLVLAHYARAIRLFAFGLLIWGLASLPSILFLDNAYVLGSPRLFYLASTGAALIWAIPILNCKLPMADWLARLVELGAAVLIFATCYLPSALYTRCELAYQGMASEVGRMMASAAHSAPGQAVTFVNLPYFFSSRGRNTECHNPFVFAPTGAVVIPPYADVRDFVWYNSGADLAARAVTVREYQPGWNTFGDVMSVEQLRQQLKVSHVFAFDLIRWRLFDLSAVWQPDMPIGQPRAVFDGVQISDFKYEIASEQITVTLTWQAIETVQERKVFVHIYDSNGRVAAQDDSIPATSIVPTSWWRAGDIITDTHTINLAGLSVGTYQTGVGMYDAVTVARIPAHDTNGARLPDDELVIAQVTIPIRNQPSR